MWRTWPSCFSKLTVSVGAPLGQAHDLGCSLHLHLKVGTGQKQQGVTFAEHLLCQALLKHFTCVNNSPKTLFSLSDENEPQKSNWPKVTELENSGAGIQTQTCNCVESLPGEFKIGFQGISLVVQWFRIHCPV